MNHKLFVRRIAVRRGGVTMMGNKGRYNDGIVRNICGFHSPNLAAQTVTNRHQNHYHLPSCCYYHTSVPTGLPMKAGTELKHFAIYKNQDPPKVLEVDQYPDWVYETASKKLPSLATLRKMPNQDATETDIKRYLKLTRRLKIRQQNDQAAT